MSIAHDHAAARRAASAPVRTTAACLALAARAWSHMRSRRRSRVAYHALSRLDARTLKDLGLHRSEILSISLGDAGGRRRGSARD